LEFEEIAFPGAVSISPIASDVGKEIEFDPRETEVFAVLAQG